MAKREPKKRTEISKNPQFRLLLKDNNEKKIYIKNQACISMSMACVYITLTHRQLTDMEVH